MFRSHQLTVDRTNQLNEILILYHDAKAMKPALLKKFAVNEILQRELQLCLHVVPLVKSSGRWLSERRRNLVVLKT